MRIQELIKRVQAQRLDELLIHEEANVLALTGVRCDNAFLRIRKTGTVLYTDFRYVPMVHRVAPELKTGDYRRLNLSGRRIGYESSVSCRMLESWRKRAPSATFVDVSDELAALRAVKTPEELDRLRAAEKLNCEIWAEASAQFRKGMTERDMARIIQKLMIDRGEGEAFSTIVSIGQNAAECHHEPDLTVWNGREPVLVDMGVRLNGVCSDLTRNLTMSRRGLYGRVYRLVKEAHDAAIAAARPGIRAKDLDQVAREVIRRGGFGKCFGHSLGHGVGYEIHEAPTVSAKSKTVLEPGMVITIEPGIYLEGNLGVRIEDMVVITNEGCELLSV